MKHAWIPILAALLAVSSSSQAQVTGQHLDRTTADLGAASAHAGEIYTHTQGADNSDCVGGGSIRVPCYSDGTTWIALSPGAAGSGDITAVGDCATGACFQSETTRYGFFAPSGGGVAAFRAVVEADISDLSHPAEVNNLETVMTGAVTGEIPIGTTAGGLAAYVSLQACANDEKLEYTDGAPDTMTCEAIGGLVDGDITFTSPDIGAATATTPSVNDNDTSVATTAFVQAETFAGEVTGTMSTTVVAGTHSGSAHHSVFSPAAGISTNHGAGAVAALTDLAGTICGGADDVVRWASGVASCIATPGGGSPGGISGDIQMNDGASGFSAAALNDDGSNITSTEPILFPDGTVGSPSIASTTDNDGTGTGIYFGAGTDDVSVVSNGILSAIFASTSTAFQNRDVTFRSANGTEGLVWDMFGTTDAAHIKGINGRIVFYPNAENLTPAAAPLNALDDGTTHRTAFVGSAPGVGELILVETSANVDLFEVDYSEHIVVGATDPVLSACGTTPAVAGSDTAGKVTIGTGVTTSCTVTFATSFAAAPACAITGDQTATTYAAATTTTVLTITSSADMDSDVLMFICLGIT